MRNCSPERGSKERNHAAASTPHLRPVARREIDRVAALSVDREPRQRCPSSTSTLRMKLQGLVPAAGKHRFPVGRICHGIDETRMASECGNPPPRLDFPNDQLLVLAGRDNAFSIRRKRDEKNCLRVANECSNEPARCGIPKLHGFRRSCLRPTSFRSARMRGPQLAPNVQPAVQSKLSRLQLQAGDPRPARWPGVLGGPACLSCCRGQRSQHHRD